MKLQLRENKLRFISGFILIAFSVFLLLSYISFFFTGYADKSKFDISWWKLITSTDINVENWTGKSGAYLSNLIINEWFGISSIALIFMLFITGGRLLGKRWFSLRKTVYHSLFIMVWISLTLGFLTMGSVDEHYVTLGGAHGYFMSIWLKSFVGYIGTVLIILISLIIYLYVTFESVAVWFHKGTVKADKSTEKKEPADIIEEPEDVTVEEEKTPEAASFEVKFTIDNKNENQEKIQKEVSETSAEELEIKIEKPREEEISGKIKMQAEGDYDPTLDLSSYVLPPIDLLNEYNNKNQTVTREELESNKQRIVSTLENYKIKIDDIKATVGPTITLYEIVPAPGIRISKIKNLEDDIALSLSALGIRIIAPIPGKGTIGIEVPNYKPQIVSMRSIITSSKFQNSDFELPVAFGKTISNETFMIDLAKAPHLLVAGATGQGKSVGLNAIITSLLYKKHPSQLKFVLIDPKKVELNIYNKIERHFLAKLPDEEDPIITDVKKVVNTLNSLTIEMDTRYDLLQKAHVRNVKEYNHKFVKRKLNPENGHKFMPYIVVIIDEFADLIMTAGKEVEQPIGRIAQLARAVGIHMIIATQRPSTNIITGVIKANFPTRVAFKVASMIDSRTILDSPGANQLIGRGDMLISQGNDLIRVQCAFVDTPEVEKINDFIGEQRGYPQAFMLPEYEGVDSGESEPGAVDLSKRDSLFEEAARVVVMNQSGSTSLIQRRFSIGYNRAGRIIDQLEAAGIIGPFEGSKARQVLVSDEVQLEQILKSL
ncbi:MAG: DNA translocase FtsK [Chlorobi bacterium]|nr:DNA translocase FtsK [Chlorobiota bacterium]